MTDYVLMPEEATPEMEQAAEKYWNDRKFKALSDDPRTWKGLYAAMRAVAPAVQGEPVAVMYEDGSLLSKADCGDNFEICCKVQTPLYAAPQPTEQQREPCHECGGNGAGGEHEEDCSQQSTHDIAKLVEALERISKRASEAECRQVPCSPIQRLFVDIMQQADDALAAHRKGEES